MNGGFLSLYIRMPLLPADYCQLEVPFVGTLGHTLRARENSTKPKAASFFPRVGCALVCPLVAGIRIDMNGKGHWLNLSRKCFARLNAFAIIATLPWPSQLGNNSAPMKSPRC